MNKFIQFSIATFAAALLASCAGTESNTTGWAINNKKNGGFQSNLSYKGQETGPGLVFVEGGTFMMGQVEEDAVKDWNNIPRRVTPPHELELESSIFLPAVRCFLTALAPPPFLPKAASISA